MISRKNMKLFIGLVILVVIFMLYVVYNTRTQQQFPNFKVLNTSDILKVLLHTKIRATKQHIFGLDLKYNINSAPCDNTTGLVIIVTSYFGNVETRSAMRRAFSNNELQKMHIKRVFLLGMAPSDQYTSQPSIQDESDRFNDILQGNFVEAYKNLTYKHMMGLKWVSEYCSRVQYVVKMDDDIVVDLRKFLTYLADRPLNNKLLLAGYVLDNMSPQRVMANKWYVSYKEYADNSYPTFLSGWFYVTNPRTARALVLVSTLHRYFWIDDTLITGIIAKQLNITHVSLKEHFTLHSEFLRCCINDLNYKGYECPFFVGPNGGDNNLFFEFNNEMQKCINSPCRHRKIDIDKTCVAERKISVGPSETAIVENYKLF